MQRHDPARLDPEPWLETTEAELAAPATVPTMLSPAERRLYHWLARDWAEGSGALVDLGCFAGGSTAYLAEGTRHAGRDQAIWAYDRFHADAASKHKFLYSAGIPAFEGTDILPLADILLEPWQPGITLVKGQIEDRTWDGPPIELLAVDAAKSAEVLDHIAGHFYTSLQPARSLVIQQDFLHWKTPWIAAQAARMAEWLEPVAFAAPDTMVFFCRNEITPDALAAGRVSGLPDATLIDAIEALADRLARWPVADRLAALAGAVRANPGARAARDIRERRMA